MINRLWAFASKHSKYLPVIFFSLGFLWDTMTLGRIDRIYDRIILCTYLISLTTCLYMYNVSDDGKWQNFYIEKYKGFLPLAIQFFLGGLFSAYVIYFSRSVSFTKSILFFVILVFLLFANELLKKRISNKYLQFNVYFFVNFTFFIFFVPLITKSVSAIMFIISGIISLIITLALFIYIYRKSPSTRKEIHLWKLLSMVIGIYFLMNTFYFMNLIPPVPLALDTALVAHDVKKIDDEYTITYDRSPWYKFWREADESFIQKPGSNIYVFTSIFSPTDFEKAVMHRWKWFSPHTNQWEIIDEISYEITGGRDKGFRGYTYKNNMMAGRWQVNVLTLDGMVLGVVNFTVKDNLTEQPDNLINVVF
ncbi:MAG: DUF2914 domain-containing protein [Balneolaceae bacterium]